MSDLISRSALMSHIENERRQWGEDYDAEQILGDIEDTPTAYDVNKVVEQLEDVGQKMSESKSIQKYGKSSPANHRYYKAVSVKRAIEIVKGGGVNE